MILQRCLIAAAVSTTIHAAHAAVVQIPLDQSQSSLTVTLCISGTCDSDVSPVAGSYTFDLDNPAAPTQATLLDFVNSLTEQIDLNISFGFLGRFDATGQNVMIAYAAPGAPTGPVVVSGGAYTFPSVATVSEGTIAYTSSGVVCTLLQGQNPPIPCSSSIDLGNQGAQDGALSGTLSVAGNVLTLAASINTTVPLDPTNPSLGSFSVVGTVRGSVTLPPPACAGDTNGDGLINSADLSVLLANFGQSATGVGEADFNGDGMCNSADLSVLLGRFGLSC